MNRNAEYKKQPALVIDLTRDTDDEDDEQHLSQAAPQTAVTVPRCVPTTNDMTLEDFQGNLTHSMDIEKEEAEKQILTLTLKEELKEEQEKPEFNVGEVYSSSESSDADIEAEDEDVVVMASASVAKNASELPIKAAVKAMPKKVASDAGSVIKRPNPPMEKEEEDEDENLLDGWTPSCRDAKEQTTAAAPEPYEVPTYDSRKDGHDDGEETYNEYYQNLYTAATGVALQGMCPIDWAPPHKSSKKLSAAEKKMEEQQLLSFQSAQSVVARTEGMFSGHLLAADSVNVWQAQDQGQLTEDKPGDNTAETSNNDPMWDFENVCNFCIRSFFPAMQPHLQNCEDAGGVCNMLGVRSTIAHTTRGAVRFLICGEKFLPAGHLAIAIPTVQSNFYFAMDARHHLDNNSFQKDPVYVLPAAKEMQTVITQAIRGANMVEVVRPACTIISALKTLVCQVRPGCIHHNSCRGGHPLYPDHVSRLQYQREFGLDFDWEYEPSFLEFAAVLDKSLFLFEHVRERFLNNSSAVPLDTEFLHGPAVALDFISAMLCRIRYEHNVGSVPLLIKVLFREHVPPTRALRLIIFQAIRLVRLEQAFSHLSKHLDGKWMQMSESISLATGACTMLFIVLDRYASTQLNLKETKRWKHRCEKIGSNTAIAINIQTRDDVYSSLLKDIKGILSADMFHLHEAIACSPLAAAGFAKASAELLSFKHEPVQQLLRKLTLTYARQESVRHEKRESQKTIAMIGMINSSNRERMLSAMKLEHLSNRLPVQEFMRRKVLSFFADESTIRSESTSSSSFEKGFQSLARVAEANCTDVHDSATNNVDPVAALIDHMNQMYSRS